MTSAVVSVNTLPLTNQPIRPVTEATTELASVPYNQRHTFAAECLISLDVSDRAPFAPQEELVPARILIVDDEPAVADLIEAVLVGEGYTVAIARDGAQGLLFARDWNPDLILLDVMLPGVDGGTAIRRLERPGNGRHPHRRHVCRSKHSATIERTPQR